MIVRRATEHDIVGIRSVSLAAGQDEEDSGAEPDYVRLLLDTGAVFVASDANHVLGWGATKMTGYGSMLTDLFVSPAHQARGIGRKLLAELWPGPDDTSPRYTFSSHHASALPLYVRAGLSPFWPLLYIAGAPVRLPSVRAHVNAVACDIAARLEAERTGLDRTADYAYWTRSSGSSAILVHEGNRLIAAGAAGVNRVFHLSVFDDAVADVAVIAVLRSLPSATASVCLPGPHPALADLLRQGFRVGDHDTYMSTEATAIPMTFAYSPGLS